MHEREQNIFSGYKSQDLVFVMNIYGTGSTFWTFVEKRMCNEFKLSSSSLFSSNQTIVKFMMVIQAPFLMLVPALNIL